jgi:signal peptidase I
MLIWSLLWSFAPMAVGWTPTVVTSGSMEPSLSVGDVVHIDESVDFNRLGAGSVIAFDDPGLPGMRVTHRVTGVEFAEDRVVGYRTKGDANSAADSTIVPVENVYGAGRLVVPYAGLPRVWVTDGMWIHLSTFLMLTIFAAVLAGDTIQQYVTGRPRRGRRKQIAAIALAIAVMLGAPSTTAAFTSATDNSANAFSMTPTWFIDTIDRDGPIAHWRLGELIGAPVTILADDFESFTGWNPYGPGDFVSSTAEAQSPVRSGYKTGDDVTSGAWKLLPTAATGSVVLDVWVWRKSKGGQATDRVGLVNSAFDGYSLRADHKNELLQIDRRTGGSATGIGTPVAFDPPEKAWFRLELVRAGSSMVLSAYDGGGTLLASTSAVDATTNSFDRAVVYGGDRYHVDDLTVIQNLPPTAAVDRIGTLDGAYAGFPVVGVPALVAGQPDTAADLDGVDDAILIGDSVSINLTTISERTTELWFEADSLGGRQVLYEEGGTVDGKNIYLDGTTLYATAWGDSLGWSNDLVTSMTVSPNTTYHVAATLDAVGTRSLVLYVDGTPVSTATKTDGAQWNAHSDDGAVGYINGGTRFHDGNSSGTGNFPFDGTVDEVILYNLVVPAVNIANHHASGL